MPNPPTHKKYFPEKNGELHVESVPLALLAEKYGTPLYVYSHSALTAAASEILDAFSTLDGIVCYSFKANSNGALAGIVKNLGFGVDIVSGGEYRRAVSAGFPTDKLVFAGVGKTEPEIETALDGGLLFFSVESATELSMIERVAKKLGVKAPVAVRINPEIDPKSHPYLSTGLKESKFGVSADEAVELYRRAGESKHLSVRGISCHIGSNILSVEPFAEAFAGLLDMADKLEKTGITVEYLDFGGGLGVSYTGEKVPPAKELAGTMKRLLDGRNYKIIFEPGRSVIAQAGILLTRVILTKGRHKRFVVVDAAMNDFIRPSLYGAKHTVEPVRVKPGKRAEVELVGPICESGDFLARDLTMVEPDPGDLLALFGAGAYGFIMASNYNSRPRPAEVLVKGEEHGEIRQREDIDNLVRGETVPSFIDPTHQQ
ncbi:diaminopimelate decarboxylase [candidate division KSB1 bacterium]